MLVCYLREWKALTTVSFSAGKTNMLGTKYKWKKCREKQFNF